MKMSMLGIIDATIQKPEIEELTLNRSLAAVPFGGRYRLIDFVLSNMVNSGIESVAIFPKHQYRSLMDHLGSGKEWDLNRKRDGLFFLPSQDIHEEYNEFGSFRQFTDHLSYFMRSTQEFAVITNCNTVCNVDLQVVLKRHIDMGCDVTEVTKDGQSLQMYILSKSKLMDLMDGYRNNGYRTLQEAITNGRDEMNICSYEHEGYAAVIDSIQSYFKFSMELLKPRVWQELFLQSAPIFTKVKDEPPTQYFKDSLVRNSMIANGSKIEGHVENSIIFRAVHIEKGTVLKNCIVMQKTHIGQDCHLENVIFDKDVKIGNGVEIIGSEDAPKVLKKGTVQGALMNS
ncbi:glucose-1-phosphate adenylyltransferase [Metabacillus sp. GX 13764]|uniref:sugar phosphate nucleotidyltransferase n=1 Tax=Metabacillus kandeliae TaxID=2900151 RepID=UPI001E2A1028|nr:sugar phosphate nucleotidyltransferase [Metabacillus kandeliae]MCD7032600.1 glucose-1-phosphate adenylyltransferase [Metabacillus kandeliae]